MVSNSAFTDTKQHIDISTVDNIWTQFWRGGGEAARNALILHYLPLVKYHAYRILDRVPGHVELDDLMQSAVFGLKDAINTYDPDRGVKFETYCFSRIRGAILDNLRSLMCAPRDMRARAQKLEQANSSLIGELGRPPSIDEIVERLGVSKEDYSQMIQEAAAMTLTDLTKGWISDGHAESASLDTLADRRMHNPVDEVQIRDLRNLLLRELSQTERMILILYYYEEMTMREIGVTLRISESRVSQLHAQTLRRLKERLAERFSEASGRRGLSVDL